MKYIKYFLRFLTLVVVFGLAHYTLRSQDVVQVVGTEVVRTEVGTNPLFWVSGGTGETGNKDVRFINAILVNEKPMVYRNEDTGWGWPPYFKFNSGDLQAEAQKMAEQEAGWVRINHYGIRNRTFSIYPNVTSIRPISSPDDAPTNWIRIVGFVTIGVTILVIWRLWRYFTLWIRDRSHALRFRVFRK